MIRKIVGVTCCFGFLLLGIPTSSRASEGGYSNYIPGFYGDLALAVAPEDGFALRNDVYFYSADADRSVRSGAVKLDVELDLIFDYLTLLHKPGIEVFGAEYAYGATLVAGNVDLSASLDASPVSRSVQDDRTSYGDITLTPAIFYWDNGDKWHFSQSFYVVVPVGDYDVDEAANIGLNYWTFETDFAATYLNQEKGQDYSVVIGYGYNTENNDTQYKSGDEVHMDFVLNQFLSEEWAVGLHGFYYKQISGDSGDGALLGGFKAEAAGIGPAVMWLPKGFGGNAAFILKWFNEFHAENRMEGDHVFASFAISF